MSAVKQRPVNTESIHLSPRKLELFSKAAALAQSFSPTLPGFTLKGSRLLSIAPDLAAAVTVVVADQYSELLPTSTHSNAHRIASDLINLLIPRTPDTLLVFKLSNSARSAGEQPKVLVRVTDMLLRDIARLYSLTVDQEASFVARRLDGTEHGKLIRHLGYADQMVEAITELCVSRDSVWVRVSSSTYHSPTESEHIPISFLGPLTFIKPPEKVICHSLAPSIYARFWPQLKELLAAEDACELAGAITFDLEADRTQEKLWKALQLRWTPDQLEMITTLQRGIEQTLQEIEEWQEYINAEKLRVCEKILGAKIGDIAVAARQKEHVRLRIEAINVHAADGKVLFYIHGARVRKDGLVGKRTETIYISAPIDHD